jgi:hypothetical protein
VLLTGQQQGWPIASCGRAGYERSRNSFSACARIWEARIPRAAAILRMLASDVALAALDVAVVATIQPALEGHPFLRDIALVATTVACRPGSRPQSILVLRSIPALLTGRHSMLRANRNLNLVMHQHHTTDISDTLGSDAEKINQLAEAWEPKRQRVFTQWVEVHANRPAILYHYTDAAGFIGILDNGELWASNAAFLNDSTELIYAQEVIKEVLDEFRSGDEPSQAVAAFGDALLTSLADWPYDVYVTCFCENGDLLGQWRGYPRSGGGYSLGVNGRVLTNLGPPRRVIYDRKVQKESVRNLLSTVEATFVEFPGTSAATAQSFLHRISDQIFYSLAECSFCFKHPAFREEAEWRVVTLKHRNPDRNTDGAEPSTLMRATSTGLLPYTPISLSLGESKTKERAISEVVIGPGRHPNLAARAAEHLLCTAGYPNAAEIVRLSSVPLRV